MMFLLSVVILVSLALMIYKCFIKTKKNLTNYAVLEKINIGDSYEK